MIDIEARAGQRLRLRVVRPAQPAGVVVLLAGGAGDLRMEPDGSIGRLQGNQLIRSRGLYVERGWAVAIPDIAPDMRAGDGVRDGYRTSADHAADLGAVIAAMRRIAQPVILVGTSRGVLSAANAAARLAGAQAPDGLVLTAGMLMDEGEQGQPSIERDVPGIGAYRGPVLLLHHRADACRLTPPSGPARLRPLLRSAARVEIVMLSGGQASGPVCAGRHFHGFQGLDGIVVDRVIEFARQVTPPR